MVKHVLLVVLCYLSVNHVGPYANHPALIIFYKQVLFLQLEGDWTRIKGLAELLLCYGNQQLKMDINFHENAMDYCQS